MGRDELAELQARVHRLEDESAITRLIMSYGPAADAGLTSFAGQLWSSDGEYDWDANGTPHQGSAAVDAMLQGDGHQNLIAAGVAHFAGPLLIELGGRHRTALNYSLIMRREDKSLLPLARQRGPLGSRATSTRGGECSAAPTDFSTRPGLGVKFFGDSLTELFAEA